MSAVRQRKTNNNALIAIETHSTEKSICPIGGMIRRTGRKTGSQRRTTSRTPGSPPPGDMKLDKA